MDRYYPVVHADGRRHLDGTLPFYEWLEGSLDRNDLVLNVGAGPTPPEAFRHMRGKVHRLVSVDPDPVVLTNTDLDEAFVNDGVRLPFPDGTFDAAYSDWTLEHVDLPKPFLAEVYRVLKPGASFWFRTPNRLHYISTIAALTPHWFHRLVVRPAFGGVATHDPWPTHYRMNCPRRLRKLLRNAGFAEVELRTIESYPGYLKFNAIAFLTGIAYERPVNRFIALSGFRHFILGRAHKPSTAISAGTAKSSCGS
jgi:SAM-dependent methyltransferase